MKKGKGMEIEIDVEKDDKWEVEDCLRTLTRAEEIKSDPEKMKKVLALAKVQKKALSSIADIKAARDEMAAKDEES